LGGTDLDGYAEQGYSRLPRYFSCGHQASLSGMEHERRARALRLEIGDLMRGCEQAALRGPQFADLVAVAFVKNPRVGDGEDACKSPNRCAPVSSSGGRVQ
jgi:hypothetical protein